MKNKVMILSVLILIYGMLAVAASPQRTSKIIKKGESSMLKQYAFFYFMKKNSQKIPGLIPEHINYWHSENPVDYSGGPFSDRSGGLILFKAKNIEKAQEITGNDPFVKENVLEQKELKEWVTK